MYIYAHESKRGREYDEYPYSKVHILDCRLSICFRFSLSILLLFFLELIKLAKIETCIL